MSVYPCRFDGNCLQEDEAGDEHDQSALFEPPRTPPLHRLAVDKSPSIGMITTRQPAHCASVSLENTAAIP